MKYLLSILCLFIFSCDSGGNATVCEKIIGTWELSDIETNFSIECENECDNDCQEQIQQEGLNEAISTGLDNIILDGENITSSNNPEYDYYYTCEDNTLQICLGENICVDWLLSVNGDTILLSTPISYTTKTHPDGTGCFFDYRMIYERKNSEGYDSSPSPESNCSNILNGSEWEAVTLDIDVLNDMAGCSYEDSISDASNLSWAFQSGVVEQNDSNPGVWTIEKYYECTLDDALEICSNQQMTNDCIIYSVEASNNSLSLTTMIVEGDECDREEILNFIPEDD